MTTTLPPAVAEAIRASFVRQTLMQNFGAQLTGLAPGHCEITAPILPTALQQHGHGHAGLTFALGDSAAGYAALGILPEGSEVMTVEMKINLLAPARGKALIATGKVIRAGRRLTVVQASVAALREDGSTVEIALLQGTMIPVPPA
ncbi:MULTISPECIES: PaaI family thioesterase [unclassified Meridianimarinicoccus]|uniref:PaaI family thioesterase n=1 Tax=unclassified Meridianimarinicoccus TaxID=2923344 RepID=UPI00186900BC|nr:PaaI family thioesterase [Fluviibacterium sp. MJW13]